MAQKRSITDFKSTNELSDYCHSNNEPLFVTKNGNSDFVVMSIEAYEEMLDNLQVDFAIAKAEEEYNSNGILLDANEALTSLRRKYLG